MASNTYDAVKIEKAFLFDDDDNIFLSTNPEDYELTQELFDALEELDRLEQEEAEFESEFEEVN